MSANCGKTNLHYEDIGRIVGDMSIQFRSRVPQGFHVESAVEAFRFPGGEWHLRTPQNETPTIAIVRGMTPDDIVILGMWADWAHSMGARAVAHIPYFPAARADRGTPFGAKVYADLVNSIGLDEVVIFDPHSPVIEMLVNNVRVVDSARVVTRSVFGRSELPFEYVGIIAPDKGAVTRAQRVADIARLPLYTATKTRNEATGKLSNFHAPEGLPEEGRLLVVDDICDGGGTFIGLAQSMSIPRERLTLWVSHGVFSGKANLLREHYGSIHTTDSHTGARREDVGATVHTLGGYLYPPMTQE